MEILAPYSREGRRWSPLHTLFLIAALALLGCSGSGSPDERQAPPAAQVSDPAAPVPENPPPSSDPMPILLPLLPSSPPPSMPGTPLPGAPLPTPAAPPPPSLSPPAAAPGAPETPVLPATDTRYMVVDLGAGLARAIDADGTVAGTTLSLALQQAALFTPAPHPLPLLPGGTFSQAASVRNQVAVGSSTTGLNGIHTHATLWQAGDTAVDLAAGDDPALFSAATSLASAAFIVGYCDSPMAPLGFPVTSACFWAQGPTQYFPTLGGLEGLALATCLGCPTVGRSETADHQIHATAWVLGSAVDLDTTGGAFSLANALTPEGVIVGAATFVSVFHAFVRTVEPGAAMQDLGVLPGLDSSEAFGVRTPCAEPAACLIVGMSWRLTYEGPHPVISRATLWQDTAIIDLNTRIDENSGWLLEEATAINSSGLITGIGRLNGTAPRAFVLVPVALVAVAAK